MIQASRTVTCNLATALPAEEIRPNPPSETRNIVQCEEQLTSVET